MTDHIISLGTQAKKQAVEKGPICARQQNQTHPYTTKPKRTPSSLPLPIKTRTLARTTAFIIVKKVRMPFLSIVHQFFFSLSKGTHHVKVLHFAASFSHFQSNTLTGIVKFDFPRRFLLSLLIITCGLCAFKYSELHI